MVDGDGGRPPVLYLAHRIPFPPDKGDRIRTYHILRWLSERASVHLACLADEPLAGVEEEALGCYCERVAVVPIGGRTRWARAIRSLTLGGTATEGAFASPSLRRVVESWCTGTRYHAAIASASALAPYLEVPGLCGVPLVVDLMDVDSQKWFDYAAVSRGPRALLYRLEGARLRRLESRLARRARAVVLVSEAEAEIARRFCEPDSVRSVTNGVDLDYFAPVADAPGDDGCVFVGALDYLPNIEGSVWFCREVWPCVRRRHPDAVVRLVGRRPSAEVYRLAELPGVEVVGQVPDVRPYVARAAVALAPLRIARGVQNKVLEALAMAKAAVVSPGALTGFDLRPGLDVLVATSPSEWVEAVCRLLSDPGLRESLGREGRRYAERHHDWTRCLDPLAPLLGVAEAGVRA